MPLVMTSLWYWSGLYVWVYQGSFWHCIRLDKCCLSWQAFDIDQGYTFEFLKAVSDILLDLINAVYHDKPLIFIRAAFREKLVSHRQAMNVNCWIRLSLSRLFLTLYYPWEMLRQAFDIYQGYVSREARLPSSGSEYKLLSMFESFSFSEYV